MKAIIVKYFGPGNVRGSRYKATDSDRNSVILSADDRLSHEGNCDAAAIALCEKMNWMGHDLVRGGLPNGDHVYCFHADMNIVTMPERNRPEFYECGICGAHHSASWDGDCREDGARFDPSDLDKKFGPNGWTEVIMPGSEDEPGEDFEVIHA